MTVQLTFSTMLHNTDLSERLEAILYSYRQQAGLEIKKREITYEQGRAEFVNNAIYGGAFDVSEMGSTWVDDFVGMSALRPCQQFSESVMGSLDNYPPALLSACSDSHGVLYAIPWMTDLSMVYYRRDLFQKTGIKEEGAFSSPERFLETLSALADAGIETPCLMPTDRSYVSIHELFIWLQASGFNYLDESGRRVTLADPGPRQVLRSYLSMHKYLPAGEKRITSERADRLFVDGKAAVRVSGPWLPRYCTPEVRDNLGMAIPMNRTYLGGSGLVMWNSSRYPLESVNLLRRLAGRDDSVTLAVSAGMLPARLDKIHDLPADYLLPEYRLLVESAIRGGVAIPQTPLSGMVEERIVTMLEMLWQRFFESQADDIDQVLDSELDTVINRLNLVLSNY
jgi:ABC-type glycerol-3-phosphate transport system substrate-binding protein